MFDPAAYEPLDLAGKAQLVFGRNWKDKQAEAVARGVAVGGGNGDDNDTGSSSSSTITRGSSSGRTPKAAPFVFLSTFKVCHMTNTC